MTAPAPANPRLAGAGVCTISRCPYLLVVPPRTGPESETAMCLSPSFVWVQRGPKWEQQKVSCRVCRRCREFRVNDYVGRALCEAAFCHSTVSVTLTYRDRTDFKDVLLYPPHFQAFIRALRRRGHFVRYLACGEYGEAKGRAHFHAILFFRDEPPSWPHKQRFWPDEVWANGHVFADFSADQRAIRYVCKYLLKAERGESWFSLSKKPPLGWDFFAQKADEQIALGVLPQSFEYRPPNAGTKAKFQMTGAIRRDYLLRLADGFAGTGTIDPERLDYWMFKSFDKAFRWQDRKATLENLDPAAYGEAIADDMARKVLIDDQNRNHIRRVEDRKLERFTEWQNEEEARRPGVLSLRQNLKGQRRP